eukprot:m.14381 g.14381  ORF g.14381 m.14381 type:complete len:160 (+) comp4297_c0_seq1:78-557(+)
MQAFRSLARFGAQRTFTRTLASEASTGNAINLTFTSSTETFFNEEAVDQVNLASSDGDLGILANHVPIVGTLKPGVVSVLSNNAESKFFVSSGTLTVNADSSVQLIAEEAVPVDQLDISAAKKQLDHYSSKVNSGDASERIEAEIAVEVYGAMVKALEG